MPINLAFYVQNAERKYMRILYIADDGKEFDDEWECKDYEWKLNHHHLNDVRLYDKDEMRLRDIFSEDTYNNVVKIIVPNNYAAKDMKELANYTGYCYYAHITEAGTWVFEEKGTDGKFVKVGD